MEYSFADDLKFSRDLLGMSQKALAKVLGVTKLTIILWEEEKMKPSAENMERFYSFVYDQGYPLDEMKAQLAIEESERKVLFHGSKSFIEGEISLWKSQEKNDFGPGFYCGEALEQAASFVSQYDSPSVYILEFESEGLHGVKLGVSTEWMLVVAYFRGKLPKVFENKEPLKRILREISKADYLVAPIADNRMFSIIGTFVDGEITDEQCKHCLAATNLGKQYVFLTEKAINQLRLMERCYMCASERKHYFELGKERARLSEAKVRAARVLYRNKGKYIEEIL